MHHVYHTLFAQGASGSPERTNGMLATRASVVDSSFTHNDAVSFGEKLPGRWAYHTLGIESLYEVRC